MILLAACSANEDLQKPGNEVVAESATDTSIVVPGRVNVYFTEDFAKLLNGADTIDLAAKTKAATSLSSLADLGVVSMTRLFPDAGIYEARSRKEGLHRWYKLVYDKSVPVTKAQATIENLPVVEICEDVPKIKQTATTTNYFFNDKYYNEQWYIINEGTSSLHKAGADINVLPLWKEGIYGSPDVVVNVVDGSLSYSHPDLKDNVDYTNSYNFVDNSTTLHSVAHGMNVASLIAGVGNNSIGIAGVAGVNAGKNIKGTTIINSQVFRIKGGGDSSSGNLDEDLDGASDFAAAVKWGADHGAVISNNSWGNVYDTEEKAKNGRTSSSMKAAIDYFNKYAGMSADGTTQVGPMAGGVVFFAAGNDNWAYGHPADYEGCIAVGAIGPLGTKSSFSNYGSWVDICAPGGEVLNNSRDEMLLGAFADNNYAYMSGTSQATPLVSGVAALIVAKCGGMGFTREDLIEALLNTADTDAVDQASQIGGRVNAYEAVHYHDKTASVPNPVTETPSTKINSGKATVSWKIPANSNGDPVYGFRVFYGTDLVSLLTSKSIKATTGNHAVGDVISVELTDLNPHTKYYATVVSYVSPLVFSANSPIVTFTTLTNRAPVINLTSENSTFRSHEQGEFTFEISDPDGDNIDVSVTENMNLTLLTDKATYAKVSFNCLDYEPGYHSFTLTVTDSYGLSAEKTVSFKVNENSAPVVSSVKPILVESLFTSQTLGLGNYFSDADGEDLTYYVSVGVSNNITYSFSKRNDTINLYALDYGIGNIYVKASDARGASASATFDVLVREKGVGVIPSYDPSTNTVSFQTGLTGASTTVKIYNASGTEVASSSGYSSAFEPITVILSDCAPGIYKAVVSYGVYTYETKFIKK